MVQIGDRVLISLGEDSHVYYISDIDGPDLYIQSEDESTTHLLQLVNGQYQVYGTDVRYQIEIMPSFLVGDYHFDLHVLSHNDNETLINLSLTSKYVRSLSEILLEDRLKEEWGEDIITYKPGNLNIIEFYQELEWIKSHKREVEGFKLAVNRQYVPVLRKLFNRRSLIHRFDPNQPVSVQMVEWLSEFDEDVPFGTWRRIRIFRPKHEVPTSMLNWLSKSNFFDKVQNVRYFITLASRIGSLDMLNWFLELGFIPTTRDIQWASENGHTHVVDWANENNI